MSLNVHQLRQDIEQQIVKRVIADALAAGFVLTVHDGEEITLKRSADAKEIFAAMFSTDDDRLYFHRPDQPKGQCGWVHFVYGNDGFDVISDHTVEINGARADTGVLAGAEALAAKLEKRHG